MDSNTGIDGLVFDKESHKYRYNGNLVAGVTSVLESAGLSDFSMVPVDILAQACAFGSEVHMATECLDRDQEVPTISPMSELYLCHYIQFLKDFQVEFIEIEKVVFSKKHMYAGTLDRVAILKAISDTPVIYDIKTGQKSIAHPIQMAAYEHAYLDDKRKRMDRYTLYLSEDGYQLSDVYKSRSDFDVFIGALAVHNYKKVAKNG